MKDGGSAFPRIEAITATGPVRGTSGMSLRDYFAGQALAGMLCNGYLPKSSISGDRDYPKQAFEIADAMLKERDHGQA